MHKFTEVASGEREKKMHATKTTFFVRMIKVIKWSKVTYTLSISRLHKFTEVASGEREKSTSLPTLCVRMIRRYA